METVRAKAGKTGPHDTLQPYFSRRSRMTSAALTSSQIRFLRGQAHELKALMQIGGKGVSEGVIAELNQLLEDHELVKVKVGAADREARDAMIVLLAERSNATLVQRIGHVAVLYRSSADKRRIVLPRA